MWYACRHGYACISFTRVSVEAPLHTCTSVRAYACTYAPLCLSVCTCLSVRTRDTTYNPLQLQHDSMHTPPAELTLGWRPALARGSLPLTCEREAASASSALATLTCMMASESARACLARYRSRFIFSSRLWGTSGTMMSIRRQMPKTTCWGAGRRG